jgi:multidrug efflux pump subunit AcrA (membrane-fusion protein)
MNTLRQFTPRRASLLLAAALICTFPAYVAPAYADDDSAADAQQAAADARQEAADRAQERAERAQARAQEQIQRAAELAQEQAQRYAEINQQRLQALQDRQDLKQLQNHDRQAELDQLKVLKDYDLSRIQREAQAAAQQAAAELQKNAVQLASIAPELSEHHHHHESLESGDDSGGGTSQIDERRPLNADGRVYVNDIAGTVVVNAWDRNEVQVTGELGYGVDHLEVTGDPSNLSVVVKPKHSHGTGESDLRLMVPAGARVEVETVSADASVRGTRGNLRVSSVSGDIGVDVQSPEVSVQTVSGDVIMRAPSKATQAHTVSGDLHLSGLQGELLVDTVSGNVSVKGSRFSDLKLKSVSGDMGLDATFSPQAMVTGETLSGTITLHVPVDLSGTATIKSFSGEAQCDLPQSSEVSSSRNLHKKRELVFGDGHGVNLQLSSFSGDVRIDHLSVPSAPLAPPAPPPPPPAARSAAPPAPPAAPAPPAPPSGA